MVFVDLYGLFGKKETLRDHTVLQNCDLEISKKMIQVGNARANLQHLEAVNIKILSCSVESSDDTL